MRFHNNSFAANAIREIVKELMKDHDCRGKMEVRVDPDLEVRQGDGEKSVHGSVRITMNFDYSLRAK